LRQIRLAALPFSFFASNGPKKCGFFPKEKTIFPAFFQRLYKREEARYNRLEEYFLCDKIAKFEFLRRTNLLKIYKINKKTQIFFRKKINIFPL